VSKNTDGSHEVDYRVTGDFVCPFCGGECALMEPPAVAHSAPACAVFMALDVLEYMRAANAANRTLN
jgi:hypothetical protein